MLDSNTWWQIVKSFWPLWVLLIIIALVRIIFEGLIPGLLERWKGRKRFEAEPKGQRASIPKRVQREVWRRDGGRCVECGSRKNLEFDHIIPISKGGSNTARNIQLLCEECNRKKSNKI